LSRTDPGLPHCYLEFGGNIYDTLSYDNKGVDIDPLPNSPFRDCFPVFSFKEGGSKCTEKCLRDKFNKCSNNDPENDFGYEFFDHNCCDCVRDTLDGCNCDVPLGIKYGNLGF